MKQVIKYAAVIFALILAASIIGGCLTAGVAVVKQIVERTEDTGDRNNNDGNGIWYRDEDGDVIFLGIHFGGREDVMSGSEEFAASEIETLYIEGMSGEVIVETWDSDRISVVYENILEGYEINKEGDTLRIEYDGGNFFIGTSFTETPKIHVSVPANKEFKTVLVDKGSGSLKVFDVTAENLKVDSGSGATNISGVDTKELSVDSGSGSVNISDVETEEMRIDSGSGSVTVKDSVLGETAVDVSSGSVTFDEVTAKNLVVDSSSGRVNYTGYLTGNCVFDTSSGSVNVEVYGVEEDYNIRVDMGSGSFYLNGDRTKDTHIEHDNAKNLLVFDSGSGRVSVEFKEGMAQNEIPEDVVPQEETPQGENYDRTR